jgi:hypothetical protein
MKTEIRNRKIEEVKTINGTIGERFNQIAVSVSYDEGGMNYFSGTTRARGYKLHCTPCRDSGNGLRESVLLSGKRDSGLAYMICEATRYNAKNLAKIAEQVDAQKIADLYLAEADQSILEYIHTLSTPRLTATATGI